MKTGNRERSMTPTDQAVAAVPDRGLASRMLPAPGVPRRLALATLINTTGNGAYVSAGTIFFVSSVGLPAKEVGFGLTIAGVLALAVGIPIGRLADRFGARRIYITLCAVEGLAVGAYVLVHSWLPFVAAACVAVAADRGTAGVRNAYIARLFSREERVRVRAYLRSVNNAGIAIGSLAGGLALTLNSRPAYVSIMLGDAATFIVTGLIVAGLPRGAADGPSAVKRVEGRRLAVLRDRRFLMVTATQAVLAFHYDILEIALPLWIVMRTGLPRMVIPVILVLTTAGAVLLQVPANKGTDTVLGAARVARRAGWLLAVSCVLFGWTGTRHSAPVILTVLLLASAVRLAGELFQASSSWGVSFGMAPEDQAGVYQAAFSTGYSMVVMIGPTLCMLIVTARGSVGWLIAGAAFLLAGHGCLAAARRHEPDASAH
jgi:MFS family permease